MQLVKQLARTCCLQSTIKQRRRLTVFASTMSQQQNTPTKPGRVATADPPSARKTTPSKWQRVVASATSQALIDKAQKIAQQLNELYPNPPIPLDHASNFQLLVAVMLSAQTTDLKVNQVTPELFKVAPDAAAMAAMEVSVIQQIIQPIGLAPTKAKNISNMSKLLLERHGGEVPSTFEELEALPGVGHKTASVVMSQAFGHAAFPVDTHIHRLAARWGLSSGKNVEQTEADLKALLPEHTWRDVHLQIIYFGREHCPAQRHDHAKCPVCSWAAIAGSSNGGKGSAADATGSHARPKGTAAGVKRKVTAAEATVTAAVVASNGANGATGVVVNKDAISNKKSSKRRNRI